MGQMQRPKHRNPVRFCAFEEPLLEDRITKMDGALVPASKNFIIFLVSENNLHEFRSILSSIHF